MSLIRRKHTFPTNRTFIPCTYNRVNNGYRCVNTNIGANENVITKLKRKRNYYFESF